MKRKRGRSYGTGPSCVSILSHSGTAESAAPACSCGQIFHLGTDSPNYMGQNHLGDPVTHVDRERLPGMIDQNHPDLTPIIAVDRSRSVQQGHSLFQRQPAAGSKLNFETRRNFKEKPSTHRSPFPGRDKGLFRGTDVHACRTGRFVRREGKPHGLPFPAYLEDHTIHVV